MNANTVKMLSASKRSKQAQIRQRLERAAMEAGVVPRAIQAWSVHDFASCAILSLFDIFSEFRDCFDFLHSCVAEFCTSTHEFSDYARQQSIFEHIQLSADPRHQFRLSLSIMQIYLDQVTDLLAPTTSVSSSGIPHAKVTSAPSLKIRDGSGGSGTFVENLTWRFLSSTGEGIALLKEALYKRILRQTEANSTSSRSHVIVKLRVEQRCAPAPPVSATLTFVDLAGSERLNRSGSVGASLQEAKSINRSLSALGKCVAALAASSPAASAPACHGGHTRAEAAGYDPGVAALKVIDL